MCSRYPNCGHAGPLMDRTDTLGDRHCETPLPNHKCPYLFAGCKGCTSAYLTRNNIPIKAWHLPQQSFEAKLTNVRFHGRGFELVYARVLMPLLSQMLQNLVKAELVSQEWADQSLLNAATHMQRTLIYRRLCGYIEIRSNEKDATHDT